MGGRVDRGVIATRISHNASNLKNAIAAANAESWRDLRTLVWSMGTEEQPNDVVSAALAAATCASMLSSTHPDYYDDAWWFFASMEKIAKEWVRQVGTHLKLEQVFFKFNEVHKGDLQVFFHFRSLMRCLDLPVQRSTLRKISKGLYHALEGARVSELSLGFGENTMFLLLFPQDYTYILSAIDPIVWARELECSEPRDWRKLSPLLQMDIEAKVLQKIHDEIDPVRLVENIKAKYIGHEYDMRCFLWFLRLGSKAQREWYLTELYETIRDAFSRVESERSFLWIVVGQFDSKVADGLAKQFGFSPSVEHQQRSERKEWFPVDEDLAKIRQEFEQLDNEGTDYIVLMDELHSDDAKGRYWMPVS